MSDEIFDEGLESESTSEAQAAANRAALAERKDRQVEHLEATIGIGTQSGTVHVDDVDAVKEQIAALRGGQEAPAAPAEEADK